MMAITEFVDEGFLQEANRLFFHPRGLALSVVQNLDGSVALGDVWDCRDEPEGIVFADGLLTSEKASTVEAQRLRHEDARAALLGSNIQPVVD